MSATLTRANEKQVVADTSDVRSRKRGGDLRSANGEPIAATKTNATGGDLSNATEAPVATRRKSKAKKSAERRCATEAVTGGTAADEGQIANGVPTVGSGNTNGDAGVGLLDDVYNRAGIATKNGSTTSAVEPSGRMSNRCGAGESRGVTGKGYADPANLNGSAIGVLLPKPQVPIQGGSGGAINSDSDTGGAATCRSLQQLQRGRVQRLKCRNSIDRQLASLVAQEMGYSNALEEKDRKAMFAHAEKLIKAIDDGDTLTADQQAVAERVSGVVLNVRIARNGFDTELKAIDKELTKIAGTLPVAAWCNGVRGFGLKSLGIIIGECGDLSLYANPAKVWKRLGLAPISGGKDGSCRMGSTWKRKGGLSAEEWTAAGYSPKRRSVMYVIGECLLKQNDGDYRKRYDESKAAKMALESEDWPKIRCHLHGMLLSTKRLVLDLWKQWNNK